MNFTPLAEIADISFYQDVNSTPQGVDFVKMRTKATDVIIRAGQRNWIDPDFSTNWQAAKAAGLRRHSYWFYDSRETPTKQADLWKIAIGNDLPEGGLWADLEESYGGAYQGEVNWKKFTEGVKARFPHTREGIYTGNWWWNEQEVDQEDYWASFPLWLGDYREVQYVVVPRPWRMKPEPVLWQYTDHGNGIEWGVESLNIDLNKTSQAFYTLFGGSPNVPPPEGDTMRYYRIVGAGNFNIRAGTSTSSADLGDLWEGDTVEVSQVVDVSAADHWGKLAKITRASGTVTPLPAPVCYISLNTTRTVEYFPEPPPNPTESTLVDLTLDAGTPYKVVVNDVVVIEGLAV